MNFDNTETNSVMLNLPHFSGSTADFPNWLDRVRFIAMAFEEIPGVISASLFSVEEWQHQEYAGYTPAIPGDPNDDEDAGQPEVLAPVFVDFVRPGQNAAIHSVGSSDYFTMRRKRSSFAPAFISTLSLEVVQSICTDGIPLYRVPIAEVIRRLRQQYGQLKDSDLAKLHAQLDEVFVPGEHKIEAIISKHRSVYYTLAASGFPTHDSDKINRLVRALAPCKVYNSAIDIYRAHHPDAVSNRFDAFINFIKAFKLSVETAASEGYAAVASQSTTNNTQDTKKTSYNNEYCWTHGACTHTSANCRFPAVGHQTDATFRKRIGGSNRECKTKN